MTTAIAAVARSLLRKHNPSDSFYMVDLGQVRVNVARWRAALPGVDPFYAVKCNPDGRVLRELARLGVGFDCASKDEIGAALSATSAERVLFAHPCKRPADLEFARGAGVARTVFDNASELAKIAGTHPRASCLLRIKVDNPVAKVPMGAKYGATMEEVPGLLGVARRLGIDVVGASFHVGSAADADPSVFERAIADAERVLTMSGGRVLDIGGGFTQAGFGAATGAIRGALAGAADRGIECIAEPGRFMVENAFTLCTPVIGSRRRPGGNDYWIADGLYGSFNCVLYDGQRPAVEVLEKKSSGAECAPSTLFGSSCDAFDTVARGLELPTDLDTGDWLMVPGFGAYTLAGACDFNGIRYTAPAMFYVG